jgi:hypothetical protein
MSEKNFWSLLRLNLEMKMYRVENRVMKGMPDVHFIKDGVSGWIELKFLPDWPKKRMPTGLKLNQALWLDKYSENGGRCWILIRIGRDFMGLAPGANAKRLYEKPGKDEFVSLLSFIKRGNMMKGDWESLAKVIIQKST